MPFTTRDKFKTYAGLTDSALDSVIDQLIPEVDELIRKFTQQNLEQANYTEFHDGNNGPFLRLRQRPVRSVVSLWLDRDGFYGVPPGSFGSTTLLTPGTDYVLVPDQPDGTSRAGKVARINDLWPGAGVRPRGLIAAHPTKALGNIKVSYVAGFPEIPADLTLAANMTVAHIRQTSKHGHLVQSESFEDYEYSLAVPNDGGFSEIPPSARAVLVRYRPVVL